MVALEEARAEREPSARQRWRGLLMLPWARTDDWLFALEIKFLWCEFLDRTFRLNDGRRAPRT